jgi:HSP20 family protein
MTEVDQGLHGDGLQDAVSAAQRRGKALRDEAIDAVESEQRSFAKATDEVLTAAHNATGAAASNVSEAARAGHDAMRKAGGQAADLWRASLDPLTHMQGEFSRWVEQAWRQGSALRLQNGPLFGESFMAAFSGAPVSDLYETDAGFTLTIDLPGLSAKDIRLSHVGDTLIVAGERAHVIDQSDGTYRVRERRSGEFRRTFALPPGADIGGVDARFENGVLTIKIPKGQAAGVHEQGIAIKG